MYIHEAVEKAVKENGKIIRSSARRPESDIYSEITPTNSYDAFNTMDISICRT